jgi:amino acid permease
VSSNPSPSLAVIFCFSNLCSLNEVAHFNAPKFYIELKDNTIKRYNTVVASSFAISIALFAIIGTAGFLTFGSASSGLILNNYSGMDVLMRLSRIAVAISLIFSFPLAFAGARDGWLDLLNIPVSKRSNAVLTQTTLAILGGVTFAASQLKELAFIMSFAGATMGNALIYVYPALMFRSAVKGMGDKASAGLKREVPFALMCAAFGIGMGGMGAKMALSLL